MAAGSLIGFFLVFVLVTWSVAWLLMAGYGRASERLAGWGPAAEKRAAAISLVLPVVLGGLVTVAIAVGPGLLGSVDHCGSHGHHPHLCLVHGGAWAREIWAVLACAVLVGLFAARTALLVVTLVSGRRRVRVIEDVARTLLHDGTPVWVAPSNEDFCFAVGFVRPRIFVSSSLWQRLDDPQRDAIVAHELAHIDNRDLWQSLLLSACAIVGPPVFPVRARASWDRATERLCDRIAADRVGDSTAVADALVAWARGPVLVAGVSFSPDADAIEQRVVAVLSDQPAGVAAAVRIARFATAVLIAASALAIVNADPVHHLFETLFGLVAGVH